MKKLAVFMAAGLLMLTACTAKPQRLYSVCKKRKEVFVTLVRPSLNRPPIDSVTQVGN